MKISFMLSKEEVKHIAHLARLELSEKEIKRYQAQLGKILDYVAKLRQVDTSGVVTADGGTRDLANVWREDQEKLRNKEIEKLRDLINMAPEVEKGQVKVKSVF